MAGAVAVAGGVAVAVAVAVLGGGRGLEGRTSGGSWKEVQLFGTTSSWKPGIGERKLHAAERDSPPHEIAGKATSVTSLAAASSSDVE